jgi:hypothetical protein
MFKKLKATFILAVFLSTSTLVDANLITVQGVEMNSIDLNGSNSTFEDFYQFSFSDYSSHTGLEVKNRAIVFIAELNSEFAMFMMLSGPGGKKANVIGDITGTEGLISFIDDPGGIDPLTGSQIDWKYSENKNDGLIYSGLLTEIWNIDVGLTKVSGVLNGVDFLTFDTAGNVSTALSIELSSNLANFTVVSTANTDVLAVDSPSSIILYFTAFSGAMFLRRIKS